MLEFQINHLQIGSNFAHGSLQKAEPLQVVEFEGVFLFEIYLFLIFSLLHIGATNNPGFFNKRFAFYQFFGTHVKIT